MALPDDLRSRIVGLLGDDNLQTLARTQELGELNFQEAVDQLRIVRRNLMALDLEDFSELPSELLPEVNARLGEAEAIINQIREFSASTTPSPGDVRTGIISQVRALHDSVARQVRPQLRANLPVVAEDGTFVRELRDELERLTRETREMLNRLRAEAGEAGAGLLSAHYEGRAKDHRTEADKFFLWAWLTAAGTAVMAVVLFVIIPHPDNDSSNAVVLRDSGVRIVILGLLTYALAFVLRNYRVQKHLETANRERATALDTFALLTESAPDEQTRAIVTAAIVQAVFSPSDTGFLGEGKPPTVIEKDNSAIGFLLNRLGA